MDIETDGEPERAAAQLEKLDFAKRTLTAELRAIQKLLAQLSQNYDDTFIRCLKYHRAKHLIGRRGISKAVAVRLAELFHVSVELFLPTGDNPRA